MTLPPPLALPFSVVRSRLIFGSLFLDVLDAPLIVLSLTVEAKKVWKQRSELFVTCQCSEVHTVARYISLVRFII